MGFLASTPKVRNSTAAIVVFLCGYGAALITAYRMYDASTAATGIVVCATLAALLFMSITFGLAHILKRTDIIDIAWGLAFIIIAATAWLLSGHSNEIGWNIQTVTAVLVTVWGLRLSGTLFIRIKRRPEDKRYVELRKKWKGSKAINTYIRIFMVQGLLAVIISVAVIIVLSSPVQRPDVYTYIGVGIWALGFLFEVVGDLQLRQFASNPKNKGKVLTNGLWRYTRHPNYFGEAAMWWGIFVIALSTYFGWLGIISPVIITYLLLFISGVPMAEKALAKRRGWKQYALRTSKFLPLPPKQV